ncbi:MAG: TetR/AcrR family transcriptional regulator [Propionibacteriaceae bacterium]|nr:TetR/AcrR family transcriptional regulator [Propionibacteriaceae bacterium]
MASCARIAHRAGINKERVYSYYGSKSKLFARVLREQLSKGTGEVLLDATDPESLAEFAGRMFDDNQAHPQYVRLLMWEALSLTGEVPEESQRREVYASRTAVIAAGQTRGAISDSIPPDPCISSCWRSRATCWRSRATPLSCPRSPGAPGRSPRSGRLRCGSVTQRAHGRQGPRRTARLQARRMA